MRTTEDNIGDALALRVGHDSGRSADRLKHLDSCVRCHVNPSHGVDRHAMGARSRLAQRNVHRPVAQLHVFRVANSTGVLAISISLITWPLQKQLVIH